MQKEVINLINSVRKQRHKDKLFSFASFSLPPPFSSHPRAKPNTGFFLAAAVTSGWIGGERLKSREENIRTVAE